MLSRRELLAAAPAAALSAPAAPGRPNFIVFLTDDHGYHDLGCQGASDLKTPHIDGLARSGVRFTDWYSNAPMCAPSRAALMTGRYPQRAGVPRNGLNLAPSQITIAKALKPHGYATGIVGKWHLGSDDTNSPNAHGFDSFFGFHSGCIDFYSHRYYWGEPRTVNYHDLWRNRTEVFENGRYMTEMITEEAKNFVAANRRRPFFLYVPYNAVHYPMHAPKKYVERFPGLSPERQMYAAMLAAADDGVGEIVATLKQLGLYDNTFVFLAGDNGATTEPRAGLKQLAARGGSNAPFRGWKFSLFDGGIRMPAVMSWPGRVSPGQVVSEVGAHFDIFPTVCAAAGVPVPEGAALDGRNVLPMVTEKAKSPHEAIFWGSDGQLAVRRGKWKLVINGMIADGTPEGRKKFTGADELFLSDLETDPGESKNLRSQHPALADELAAMVRKWADEVSPS
jgi:arylsulfatase A-like enzyme